jgi:hypothetical protein
LLKQVDPSRFSAANSAYKPLLYLAEYVLISRILQRPLQNCDELISYVLSEDGAEWTEEKVFTVRWNSENKNYPISPLQYTLVGAILVEVDADDEVEIFEVNLLGNKVSPPREPREVKQENSLITVGSLQQSHNIEDDSIRDFLLQYSLSAQGYDQEIKGLDCKSKKFSVELDFMANYFAQTWGLSVTGSQTPKETLHVVMEQNKKSGLKDNSEDKQKKRKRDDENPLSEDIIPNPLVYFNVEGEIVPILRSAFKHILASLQVHNPTREEYFPLEIFVNEYSKHTIDETLDFLQITPHFIRFLDCEF